MKKVFIIIGAAFLTVSSLNAQTPVVEGNFIIDAYAGIPNWANSILFSQYSGSNASAANYKVNGSMLSYGGRFEYMIADNMGVGLDVNYEVSGFNYDYIDSTFNSTSGTYTTRAYNFDYRAKKLRAMARMNYHFVQNDRIDVYAGFAGGYKHIRREVVTEDMDNEDIGISGALVPVALRISIGTRVYFTNNIGAMIELGAFGGGLLQFGITAKF